jgi:DNA-binding SARP family transcriptional activator
VPGAEALFSALVALLALWLGVTVLSRSATDPAARVFGFLTLLLTVWAGAISLRHVSTKEAVQFFLERTVQEGTGALLPAALLHLVVAFAFGSRATRGQRAVIVAAYLIGIGVVAWALLNPEQPFHVGAPHYSTESIPGEAFGWAWVVIRIGFLGLAPWWAWQGQRSVAADEPRRLQAMAVLAAVTLGALGGAMRVLSPDYINPSWLGFLPITGGLLFATYGVLAQRVFLAPDVARRALTATVGGGLLVALYAVALVGADELITEAFGIEVPVVLVLALAITLAVFDPVRDWLRARLARWSGTDPQHNRLLRIVGGGGLTRQPPDETIGPALSRLAWRFDLGGARVWAGDRTVAVHGEPDAGPLSIAFPLPLGEAVEGRVLFGAKRSGLAFTPDEAKLLERAAAYIGDALRLAERQTAQAHSLESLTRDAAEHESVAGELQAAIAASGDPGAGPLHVFALGPLRVERGGTEMRRWGGAKAGSRQAEAVFAFLYDRGERGVAKDEFLEVIWPDVPVDRADAAFHRTMNGLRHTLDPGWQRRSGNGAITFHHDRYHLDPQIVAWADVDVFISLLADAHVPGDAAASLATLERARALYRGDYLDDCPFYGDSAEVEERRGLLRSRYVDLLIALGERYEARGDRATAAAAFREALLVSGDELPLATAGLARLGAAL